MEPLPDAPLHGFKLCADSILGVRVLLGVTKQDAPRGNSKIYRMQTTCTKHKGINTPPSTSLSKLVADYISGVPVLESPPKKDLPSALFGKKNSCSGWSLWNGSKPASDTKLRKTFPSSPPSSLLLEARQTSYLCSPPSPRQVLKDRQADITKCSDKGFQTNPHDSLAGTPPHHMRKGS